MTQDEQWEVIRTISRRIIEDFEKLRKSDPRIVGLDVKWENEMVVVLPRFTEES